MPEKKTLNEDLFYKGSSANLPRLHTCENKVPFWDFKEFTVTLSSLFILFNNIYYHIDFSFEVLVTEWFLGKDYLFKAT